MEAKFSRESFENAGQISRVELAKALVRDLGSLPRELVAFHATCYAIIEQLRHLGHDIWSLDEADDFQVWGPDYQNEASRGLLVRFSAGEETTVEWQEASSVESR